MAFIDDLVTLIEDASVAELGTDLFITTKGDLPLLVSGVVSIVETGGTDPLRIQNSTARPAYVRPSAQITVRAATPDLARAKSQACYDAVVGVRNSWVTDFVTSGWYREINPLQEPFDAGVDDRKQSKYVFNVIAIRRNK
jgi:hypothetical protein